MIEILSGSGIAQAIRSVHPKKIAVAFIGNGWDTFFDPIVIQSLESIVISPTEGSNPDAILELVEQIGWKKVFFLENLHAKMYIGEDKCVIGSSNLSNNGLAGDETGLLEVCVKMKNSDQIDQIYNDILFKANQQFPNTESKKAKLKELRSIWNSRISSGFEKIRSTKPRNKLNTFENFDFESSEYIYLSWFTTVESKPSLRKTAGLVLTESRFADWMYLTQRDCENVKRNSWLLCWKRTNNGNVCKNSDLSWMYVHDVFKNVSSAEDYPSLAVQYTNRPCPSKPFKLTKNFKKRFLELMKKSEYKGLRIIYDEDNKEKPFSISSPKVMRLTKNIFDELKQ